MSYPHTTTSTDIPLGASPWDADLSSDNPTFDLVLTVVGVYDYVCTPHIEMGMVGQITVLPVDTESDIVGNWLVDSVDASMSMLLDQETLDILILMSAFMMPEEFMDEMGFPMPSSDEEWAYIAENGISMPIDDSEIGLNIINFTASYMIFYDEDGPMQLAYEMLNDSTISITTPPEDFPFTEFIIQNLTDENLILSSTALVTDEDGVTEETTMVFYCSSIEYLIFGCMDATACNYNSEANTDDGSCVYAEIGYDCNGNCINDIDGDGICDEFEDGGSEPNINVDTIFFYDCSNTLILPEENIGEFSFNFEDYDEGIPPPYADETDADVLDYVSSFFWQYTTDQPNGVATFDYDENPDPSVPDSAWYFTAYSWFTDITLPADNWLGMGPVTIPDEGAVFKFHYRGAVSQWKDGFDLYITEGGMEPYYDVDPGYTDIAYSIEDEYPCAESDTIWAEHTVSLNDFAGKSIYFTFHHTATDKERIMLDNFLITSNEITLGCTDPNYLEYDPNATIDDGSCVELSVYGCNNPWAINYNDEADLDDGSCIYEIYNGDGFVTSDCSILGDFETQVNISNDQITFNYFGESIILPIIYADGSYLELESTSHIIQGGLLDVQFNSPNVDGNILYSSIELYIDMYGMTEECNVEIDLGINPYFGCTDNNAFNYNPWANIDDGNCLNYPQYDCNGNWYQSYQQEWIGSGDCQSGFPNFNCEEFDFDGGDCLNGCTDESACNFDVWANADNGTCIYPGENEFLEYVNTYFSQGTDLFSQGTDLFSQGSDMFSQGTNLLSNFWDVLSFNEAEYSDHDSLEYLFETYSFYEMITGYNGEPIDVIVYDTVYVGPSIYLQGTNLFSQGTNLFYNGIESLFETIVDQIYSIFWDYETEGVFDCEGCVNDINNNEICDEFEIACPYPEFIEYNPDAPLYDVESCETFIVYGCMDEWAYNFNPDATVNDGSCQGCTDELAYNYSPLIEIENNDYCEYLGCVNPMAENYNSQVNIDDGSCIIYGCTLSMYPNYNPEATIDDGSCSMNSTDIYGCMDSQALNYNIEATIDNGGCEYPIGCPLPENWQYETTGTNHTMMIPEGISIDVNGEPLTMGSSIGVFYHNENGELQCAGYTQINGEQTFIAIMGDDSMTDEIDGFQEGEEFIWMVWDILTCAQYELDPSYSVGPSTFTVNGLTFLDALEHYTCQQIEFPGGWFVYSSYIQTEDMDAELVMSSIVDNLIILKDNGGNAYLPEWTFNGIGELDFHYGYQIKTNTAETLEICGLQMHPEDQPIALQSGWNIVSYLRESPSPADEVFADLNTNDNLIIVKDYNGNPYLPEWDFNGIGNMYPGQGYQLKIYEADTLIYLSNDQQYRISTSQVIENSTDYFAKVNPTGNNMHIVIPQDAWDIIPEIGSEIAAYNSNGLLVGSAKYSNPTTVLTLWGDDKTTETIDGLLIDEAVLFKVWDKEQISDYKIENWSVGSNAYQVDAIHVAAVVEIEDFTQTTNLFDAIPNPSQTKTNISFFIAETQRVNISVYNVVGELVEVLANSEYNPGTHQLEIQVSNIEAGSYFYTMRAGEFEKTKQLVILK